MLGLGNSITSSAFYDDVSWAPTDVDGLVIWHKNDTNIAVGLEIITMLLNRPLVIKPQ